MSISIKNGTRRPLPRIKFEALKNKVLGEKYELSLVFCGDALSHSLNLKYRSKDKPTNVLAFPLSKSSGEIFINLSKTHDFSALELFIHGCLHLKGMEHGDIMTKAEKSFVKRFLQTQNGATNRSRH